MITFDERLHKTLNKNTDNGKINETLFDIFKICFFDNFDIHVNESKVISKTNAYLIF